MDILTLGKISAVKRETDKKIKDLDLVVTTALTATTDLVDTNLAQAVTNLNTALTTTENTLNASMTALDTATTNSIDSLTTTTTASIDAMGTTITNCMTCVNCDLDAGFAANAGSKAGVQWITQFNYCGGELNRRTCGVSCAWCVPTGVTRVTFDVWGAGGAGAGSCSYNCCMTWAGAQGGYYNSSCTVAVQEGWCYGICAGGGRCCLTCCRCGCHGCRSCVSGCNMAICAMGGHGGCTCGSWRDSCDATPKCIICTKHGGGCFGTFSFQGVRGVRGDTCCHCNSLTNWPTAAPGMGQGAHQALHHCWSRKGYCCVCGFVPVGHGGYSGMTTYCGSSGCTQQGAPGGPGVVKITYA